MLKVFQHLANILLSKASGFEIKCFKTLEPNMERVIGFPFPRESAYLGWVRGELSEDSDI